MKTILRYSVYAILIYIYGCTCATDNNTNKEIDPTTRTNIRCYNYVVGADRVKLYQNDRLAIDNIIRGNSKNEYVSIPSGVRNVRLFQTDNRALFSINGDFAPEKNYSLIAFDTVSRVDGILLEDNIVNIPEGKTAIRLVHAAKNANEANVFTEASSDKPIIAGISYRSFSSVTIIPYPSSLQLQINTSQGVMIFPVSSSLLREKVLNTLVISGTVANPSFPLTISVLQ